MDDRVQPPDDLAALRNAALQTARSIRTLQRRADAERSRSAQEQKAQALALSASNALLAAALEASPDALLLVDTDGRVLLHNARFNTLWGWPAGSLVGEPLAGLVERIADKLHEAERYRQRMKHSPGVPEEPGAADSFELLDGRLVERVVTTLWLEGGVAGHMERWGDVSERQRRIEAAQTIEVARRAGLAKSEFMSRMSHELRTPLNAILGFAQLLEVDPPTTPPKLTRTRIGYIISAGRHLLALVDDLLHIARIEGGALGLNQGPVNVDALLAESVAMTRSLAVQQGVQLEFEACADPQLAVRGDPARLRQVLVNLISNACKYNHVGGHADVRVEASAEQVVLLVSDTGHGLSPNQVAALFEPFRRAPTWGHAGASEGTGLGLVITRQLVLAMQGDITVDSVSGVGTTVRVSLPRAIV